MARIHSMNSRILFMMTYVIFINKGTANIAVPFYLLAISSFKVCTSCVTWLYTRFFAEYLENQLIGII
ncbi:hypothetical protein Riv7116_1069 [Rivularia sp. PCC 7116]|nr:hypothetical protein Riv7116_1069 [Rivularia sp. PCC 7116]